MSYKKQVWQNNERLNADKLNAMDNEIVDLSHKVNNNYELVVKHAVTEEEGEVSFYRDRTRIENDDGTVTGGVPFNYQDVLIQVNIPVIDSTSTTNYGGAWFVLANTDSTVAGDNRIAAFTASWKQNIKANMAIRSQIVGGRVFSDSAWSTGNTSNVNAAYRGYCNLGAYATKSINSLLIHIYNVKLPKGTIISIYAR